MERVIETCLADEPVRTVTFRKGDQATVLATAFNGFLGRVREDRREWLGVMEWAEQISEKDPAGMQKAVADLSRAVSKYR